ncbi:ABC transporter permease [Slackia exigua]|uniref:Efflux ABC transporter, permease protein n=2 Tax=Slackia TaxID=84108 RepID=D0WG17_SLAES|nr:ABC transporter permease [Slackia exigua]EEZ61430.1 efflux ABC transporter, permease protein [Slackia exigua ATCC 700122]STN99059.1 FtsX-like permease family [Slackia exigua]
MDFFTFSLNNVLRDKESYVAFWLSSVFSIVVFFVFSANMNHPQLAQSESIQDIMRVAAAFIAVYSLGFLGLSLNAFLKRKRRLYGALRTMGMTKRQVALSIMLESLLIGASAIAVGLIVGLVFGHLMVMLMARIIRIEDVAYQFPIVSIVQTAATFVVIFLVASAVQARGICRRPIVELLASKVDESRGMRFSKPLAVLGIALLACGCGACLFGVIPPVRAFLEPHDELAGIIPWFIVGCTFAGIFLVYRQFSFLVLSWLARSRYYLEEGNAIWMSGLRDRIKGSVMTMFVSTVMLAMSFSAIIVSLAFVTTVRADVSQDIPFGIGYFSYGDNARESSDIDEIETQLDANGVAYTEDSYDMLQTEKTIFGTKFIAQSAYERQSGTTLALDDGQAVGISGTPDSEDSVEALNGVSFKVVGTSAPVLDDAKRFGSYVVTDADWQRLHEAGGLVNVRAFIFDVDDEGQAQEVRTACESVRETIGFGLSGGEDFLFIPRIETIVLQEYSYEIYTYISFMLSIVFIVASISLIYFRLLSDVRESLPVMRNLNRMGLSVAQVLRIQKRQLQVLFSLPIGFAVVLTGFAMAFLMSVEAASAHIFVRMAATIGPLIVLEAMLFMVLNGRFEAQVRAFVRPWD